MSYKAVIFDLDGTLVDTAAGLADALNSALDDFSLPRHSIDSCRRMIGNGFSVFVRRALPKNAQHLHGTVLAIMKRQYHDKCLQKSTLYDHVLNVVLKLHNMAIRLAVLTNKDQAEAEVIIRHFFGPDIFEFVIGSGCSATVKPGNAVMEIVKNMGLTTGDFLLVGDSEVDIETAALANIRSVGVSWGFRSRQILQQAGADTIIDNPSEILNLIT